MEQSKESRAGFAVQDDTGRLSCRKVRGSYQYCINNKYVSKQKEWNRIKNLAQAEYRSKLCVLLEKEIKYLKRIIEGEKQISALYTKLYEGKRILFEPDILPISEKIKRFEQEEHVGLPFNEDDYTEYYTNRGERVRSKSEKIIADELNRQGIPYKYEKPLLLLVDGVIKKFHPDFTVMNRTTGEIKYVEHLGMIDNPFYLKNTLSKLDIYEKNNLLIGRDVILLHESSYRPLNTKAVADYIIEFLM